jgi:uncharacterized iron-regulated protein
MYAFIISLAIAQGSAQAALPLASLSSGYVPQRVYSTAQKEFSDFEVMLADLARADVVLVGEQHDDPNTHRIETAILQGLTRRRVPVTLSLEMFERDVQASVDAYLAGTISEEDFLKTARPWPRYATDYRALVEMAKDLQWPVIAANVPRKYAADIAKSGIATLDKLGSDDRAMIARDLQCPLDAYFERFVRAMRDHPASSANPSSMDQRAISERYYQSQCVKDETMAESISAAFERHGGRPGAIVHFTGAFHTDFGAGTAERVRRRLADRRVIVVSILPVPDLDALSPGGDDLKRAEYLIYTIK